MKNEVSKEEKNLNDLKDSSKDNPKRYHALKSLIKLYSEQTNAKQKIRSLYNTNHAVILPILLEKIAKFSSSSIGKIIGLGSNENISDLIRLLEEFFYYLEPKNIQFLVKNKKELLIVLCYKGIDYMNNKEIRRSIFSIILHIMDSFENITSDMDFVVLFIYSIDFQNIIINKNVDSPSSIYELINCRLESTFFMGDIPKLFKENSNQHSVSIEEFSRELIIKLFAFIKDRAHHPQQWLELFKSTWMMSFFIDTVFSQRINKERFDILKLFDSKEYLGRAEYVKFTENTKPPIVQPKDLHMSILKTVMQMFFELLLIDSKTILTQDDFDIINAMVRTYCKKPEVAEEINKIMDLFYKFALKKGGINVEGLEFVDISHKILELCIELLKVEFAEHKDMGSEISMLRAVRVDEMSLKIFDVYTEKYPDFLPVIKKAFFTFLDSLQKPSDGSPESKQSTQNPLINQLAHQKQSVSLIILKLIDLAINEKYEERELMIDRLGYWLQIPEMKDKLIHKLLAETTSLINALYKEDGLIGFAFKVQFAGEEFQMKSEYVMQLLLQNFCEKSEQIEGKFCGELFERGEAGLVCVESELELTSEGVEVRKRLEEHFRRWILLLIIVCSQKHVTSAPVFNVLYKGISSIIDYLIDPDRDFVQERGKPPPKPKYSLSTQSHLQFFRTILKQAFAQKDRDKIEGKLHAIKSYCRIFCETRSEIPLGKQSSLEVIKFIYRELQALLAKPDDAEKYMVCCVIIYYTQELFSMDYEGTLILVPLYLKVIELILLDSKLNTDDNVNGTLSYILQKKHPMIGVQTSALLLLKSFLSFSYGLPQMKVAYFNNGQQSVEMRSFFMRIVDITNRFCDKQCKVLSSKNEEMAAIQCDVELNYGLKTLLFMIICYYTSLETNLSKSTAIQDCINNFLHFAETGPFNAELFYLYVSSISALSMAISPLSSWHRSLYQDMFLKLSAFIMNFRGPADQALRRDMMMEPLFALLSWIQTDNYGYLISSDTMRTAFINLLQHLDSKEDYKDINDVFFKHFIKNYLHFPAKYQSKDNVRSIFDEHSFKHIPRDYLKIFAESHKLREESEKLKADLVESPTANMNDVNSLLKHKSEVHQPTEFVSELGLRRYSSAVAGMDVEIVGNENSKHDIEIPKPEANKSDKSDKSEPEQSQLMQFLSQYKYILKSDSMSRLSAKGKDDPRDTIHTFNNLLNSSTYENMEGPPPLYLFMEDGTIISLLDLSNKEEKTITSKLIMRNLTGKYAWSFEHLKAIVDANLTKKNLTLQDIVADKFYTNFSMRSSEADENAKEEKIKGGSHTSFEPDNEKNENGENGEKTDELAITEPTQQSGGQEEKKRFEKMESLKENVKDHGESLDKFEEILNKVKEEIENFSQFDTLHVVERKDTENIFAKEKEHQEDKKRRLEKNDEYELQRINDQKKLNDNKNYIKFSERVIRHNTFDPCRLLMLQLKFFNPTEKFNAVSLLDSRNPHYQTTLNLLDQTYVRETVKIGVVYVANGQDTQQEILRNSSGSKDYEEFIKALGDVVDLKTHLGFAGGLKYKTDGEHTIYSSDSLTEVMYHIATMMPLDADDEQVISKKRHIGNDHVNIVWCENPRDYRRLTISSQYNCVQIIIYPLKMGLFRVKFYKKDNIGLIFPWLSSLLVAREYLPTLIKICAINGYRRSRNPRETAFKSYFNRMKFIKEIKGSSQILSQNDVKLIAASMISGQLQVDKMN